MENKHTLNAGIEKPFSDSYPNSRKHWPDFIEQRRKQKIKKNKNKPNRLRQVNNFPAEPQTIFKLYLRCLLSITPLTKRGKKNPLGKSLLPRRSATTNERTMPSDKITFPFRSCTYCEGGGRRLLFLFLHCFFFLMSGSKRMPNRDVLFL